MENHLSADTDADADAADRTLLYPAGLTFFSVLAGAILYSKNKEKPEKKGKDDGGCF
jgi:hypothetical protein